MNIYTCDYKTVRNIISEYPDYIFYQQHRNHCLVMLVAKEQTIVKKFNLVLQSFHSKVD